MKTQEVRNKILISQGSICDNVQNHMVVDSGKTTPKGSGGNPHHLVSSALAALRTLAIRESTILSPVNGRGLSLVPSFLVLVLVERNLLPLLVESSYAETSKQDRSRFSISETSSFSFWLEYRAGFHSKPIPYSAKPSFAVFTSLVVSPNLSALKMYSEYCTTSLLSLSPAIFTAEVNDFLFCSFHSILAIFIPPVL